MALYARTLNHLNDISDSRLGNPKVHLSISMPRSSSSESLIPFKSPNFGICRASYGPVRNGAACEGGAFLGGSCPPTKHLEPSIFFFPFSKTLKIDGIPQIRSFFVYIWRNIGKTVSMHLASR